MLRSIYLTPLYHRSLHKLFRGDIFYQLYDLSDLIFKPLFWRGVGNGLINHFLIKFETWPIQLQCGDKKATNLLNKEQNATKENQDL